MNAILELNNSLQSLNVNLVTVVVIVREILFALIGGNATSEKVNLRLYNAEVSGSLLERGDFSAIDPNKNTLFVFHGFRADWKAFDQICRLHIANDSSSQVVNVDWMELSSGYNYVAAVKNAQTVGNYVGEIMSSIGLRGDKTRMMGLSLGAHTASFAAKQFRHLRKETVSRIYGLDPAGPLFSLKDDQYIPAELRLDKTDADIVVTVKTNRGLYGAVNDFGHVNFYVNNAVQQPGCELLDINCSHHYALHVYAESILKPKYLGSKFQYWSKHTPIGLDPKTTLWFLGEVREENAGLYHFTT